MFSVTYSIAFLAGIVSFAAPCIIPLVPGFLAYLAGGSGQAKRSEIFLNSIFYVLGFTIVFSVLGILLNTILETVAFDALIWLARIGGVLIIFFGLYLLGLVRIPFLESEHKILVKRQFSSRYLTSFVFGAAFAAGWTPCVGAVLGSILGLAATSPGIAFGLLVSYSLGLGLPFLVVGLFTTQASRFIARNGRWFTYLNKAFGAILVVLGVLVFIQKLSQITSFELLRSVVQ